MYSVLLKMQKTIKNRALFTAGTAHLLHDGFTDMLYVFFPLWQVQFSLSFMEIGFMKTLFSGTMALFQVPASALAERIGSIRLLLAGSVLTSVAVYFYGWTDSSLLLGVLLVCGGLGSSVQHPLSSSLLTHACPEAAERRLALSTFNMAGDFGKLLLPAAASLLIFSFGWESAAQGMGLLGFFVTALLFFSSRTLEVPELEAERAGKKSAAETVNSGSVWKSAGKSFWALVVIGILDSATRMGFLTFFPFILQANGADIPTTGLALSLVFAGGAMGKLICGILSAKWGDRKTVLITESGTCLCILGMLFLPLPAELALAFILGIVLNGTSSVLYGSVPDLVAPAQCQQGFAVFYTAAIAAGAVSPWLYGGLSDILGIRAAVTLVAISVCLTLPLAFQWKKSSD